MLCDVFFFKQKTAYEMRISDWSSDVCSSDLIANGPPGIAAAVAEADRAEVDRLTQEVFAQRKRVADAQRALQARETKKAREEVRIGTTKMEAALRRLHEPKQPAGRSGLGRLNPGYYCPWRVKEGAGYVWRLMRYPGRCAGCARRTGGEGKTG